MRDDFHLDRFRGYTELFYSYFPADQRERDLVVLRGHQLIESLLFQFLRANVPSPNELDDFRARWESVLALVKALRNWNEQTEDWVWSCVISLEKVRNRVAHDIESTKADRAVAEFVSFMRRSYPSFDQIPGNNDLKKAIFVLYFSVSELLALEEFPNCTATHLAREAIARECREVVSRGLKQRAADT